MDDLVEYVCAFVDLCVEITIALRAPSPESAHELEGRCATLLGRGVSPSSLAGCR